MTLYASGISLVCALAATNALGHGEDKFGPHKGFVRMPGAFHTELVAEGGKAHIYLLDVDWKNPTVEGSSVKAKLQRGKARYEMKCSPAKDYFVCENVVVTAFQDKDLLEVSAERNGQSGIPVNYEWPLILKAPEH